MALPVGVTTRLVTLGPGTTIEAGDALGVRATVKASRDLVWAATGTAVRSVEKVYENEAGLELEFELPVTDQAGWLLNGAVVDVSDGKQSHYYVITVEFFTAGVSRPVSAGVIGPISLPTGDGSPVDADKLIPATTTGGATISVPDSWSEAVALAQAAAAEAAAAVLDSDAFVASKVADPESLTGSALSATIDGYDVILLAGQSNMQGADNAKDNAVDLADSRIFEFGSSGANASTIQPAAEPLHHIPGTGNTVGPGMPFARWWANRNPNRKVLLVPCAWYSTGFEANDPGSPGRWKVADVGGTQNLFEFAVDQANAAMAAAGPGARVAAMLWCQGEADAATVTATYQTDLLALIDGFRTQITGAAKTPFLVLPPTPEWLALGGSNKAGIVGVHVDTPYLRERCGFAPGAIGHATGTNTVHYDAVGQRLNGSVGLPAAYLRAIGNVIGTAPVPPTDVKVSQDSTTPTTANVTWTAAAGRVTDYTVQYRTADGEAWITLTRTRSLAGSATITGITLGNQLQVQVLTVNENGTSDPSAVARVAILATPAITLAQTTSDTVTVTTAAVTGASGYRFDYKLSASSTWTIGTPQVGTSLAISGLSTTAPYDFRVAVATIFGTAIKASTTYQLGTLPIDPATLATAFAQVYGPRKIVLGYAGSALRVRRSSDSTETDIGFTSNGTLDVAALLTFCGSGDGYVTTWYDQSGNARNFTQTTAANQPKLVSAGAVVSHNGRPAISFDGTDDYLLRTAANLWAAGAATVCAVASGPQNTAGTSQQCILGEGNTASNNPIYMLNKSNGGKFGFITLSDATSDNVVQDLNNTADAPTFIPDSPRQFTFIDTGTEVRRYRGGAALLGGTRTYSRSGKTLTLNRQAVGSIFKNVATMPATMLLSELVVFYDDLSDTDRVAVETNQKAFYGTPAGL